MSDGLEHNFPGVSVAIFPNYGLVVGTKLEALPILWSDDNHLRVVVPQHTTGIEVLLANFGDRPVDACIKRIDGQTASGFRRAEPGTYTLIGEVPLYSRMMKVVDLVVVNLINDDARWHLYQGLQLEVVPEELVTGSNPPIEPVLARSAAT